MICMFNGHHISCIKNTRMILYSLHECVIERRTFHYLLVLLILVHFAMWGVLGTEQFIHLTRAVHVLDNSNTWSPKGDGIFSYVHHKWKAPWPVLVARREEPREKHKPQQIEKQSHLWSDCTRNAYPSNKAGNSPFRTKFNKHISRRWSLSWDCQGT